MLSGDCKRYRTADKKGKGCNGSYKNKKGTKKLFERAATSSGDFGAQMSNVTQCLCLDGIDQSQDHANASGSKTPVPMVPFTKPAGD